MGDFRTLKLLDKLKWAFERFGIDYSTMRKILQIKLLMDSRRVPTIFSQQRKKQKKDENQFLKSLWMYGLFGLFLIPFIIFGEDYLFQMSISFSVIMFFVMSSMIADFSSVLLDIRDNVILGTKPIKAKTIGAAKLIHICIYMFFLSGSMIAVPFVVAILKQGVLFAIIFLLDIILLDFLCVVFTAFVYFLILKFFDGERLKDIINYVQIILSFTIIVGYQVVVRSFEFIDLKVSFALQWWHYFIIPIWYAAPFELFLGGNKEMHIIIFSALAILAPIISLIIYVKLIPSFERNLQKLENGGATQKKTRWNIRKRIAQLVCTNREEMIFYQFADLMMTREREFKLKVYPSIGFSIIIPFIFLFIDIENLSLANLASSKKYLTIYMCGLLIPTVVMMLRYSGTYKGSWLYGTTPIKDHTAIYKGTLKAVLLRFFIPIFIILSIIYIAIFSLKVIPSLLVVLICLFLYTIICFNIINGKALPFSEAFVPAQQSDTWKVFLLFFILGGFAGIHYLSLLFPYGVYILLLILLFVNFIAWKKGFKSAN